MMNSMQLLLVGDRTASPRRRCGSFRPGTFPIVVGLVSLVLSDPGVFATNAAYAAKPAKRTTVNVLPELSTTVSVIQTAAGPVLQAVTTLDGKTFTQVLDLTATPSGGVCPILNLHLGPIDLNLLGLEVTTSEICLNITAFRNGGLLGNLLCGIANLLNDGVPLSTILANLTGHQLNTLTNGLTNLINGALGAVTTTGAPGTAGASTPSVTGTAAGSCDILNLSLGPINLNLLGLVVNLNNCHNGPVTVDITASPAGGLLGQLLCDLDSLLNSNAGAGDILNKLTAIAQAIAALLV